MPIETDHLRESGIGKVIAFYTKCDRIEPKIRRMAEQLVLKWSRPIIKRTENYKDKRRPREDYVVDEQYVRPKISILACYFLLWVPFHAGVQLTISKRYTTNRLYIIFNRKFLLFTSGAPVSRSKSDDYVE